MADYTGNTLTAFADTYLRARALSNAENAQEAQERDRASALQLRELQMEKARLDLADRAALPEDIQSMMAGAPDARVMVPGTPGTPETPVSGQQVALPEDVAAAAPEDQGDVMAANVPPTIVPGTPGIPPKVEQFHTPQSIAKNVGAAGMGRIMGSPEGRAAYTAMGPISEAEITRRQKAATGFEEAKALLAESSALSKDGDVPGAYMKEAAAMERIAEGSQDETRRMRAMERAQDLRNKANALNQDPVERRLAGEDMKRIAPALTKYRNSPDEGTLSGLIDAYAGAKSKSVQARAMVTLERIASSGTSEFHDPSTGEFWKAVANEVSTQTKTGKKMDFDAAISSVVSNPDNLEMVARALPAILEDKNVPTKVRERLLGAGPAGSAPKSKIELASDMAKADGETPGTPKYYTAIQKHLKALTDDGVSQVQIEAELRRSRSQAFAQLKDAQKRLAEADGSTSDAAMAASRDINSARNTMRGIDARAKELGIAIAPPAPDAAMVQNRARAIAAEEAVKMGIKKGAAPTEQQMTSLKRRVKQRLMLEGLAPDE